MPPSHGQGSLTVDCFVLPVVPVGDVAVLDLAQVGRGKWCLSAGLFLQVLPFLPFVVCFFSFFFVYLFVSQLISSLCVFLLAEWADQGRAGDWAGERTVIQA